MALLPLYKVNEASKHDGVLGVVNITKPLPTSIMNQHPCVVSRTAEMFENQFGKLARSIKDRRIKTLFGSSLGQKQTKKSLELLHIKYLSWPAT